MNDFAPAEEASIAAGQSLLERNGARLCLHRTRSGSWRIVDESGRCGGIFATQEAALKFIRLEFGPQEQVTTVSHAQSEAA